MSTSIIIKEGLWDLTKKENKEYMLYGPKAGIFMHGDSLKFSSDDKKNINIRFYLHNNYIGCLWIEDESDRLAIEGLMAL